jgi:hypothetical protein
MWLASKPADETFDWGNLNRCACAQYSQTFDCEWSFSDNLVAVNRVALGVKTFGQLYKSISARWEWENVS